MSTLNFNLNSDSKPLYIAAAVISEAHPEMTATDISEFLGVERGTPEAHQVDLGFWKVSQLIGRTRQYA